ncbi:ComF family protein [Herbaspirillum rhizosphaerae]|uniref:ComF family protein n=1 Tax=Herbaspirillum rhizosphaerae TaxID=346179 RepID=UPI00067DAA13|nr:ComF family protein [Herbaspirillum rhizosphaerae]
MFARLQSVTRSPLWPRWLPQLLPSSCVLCGQTDRNALCQPCRQQHFTLRPRRCVQCAMPIPTTAKEIRCGDCLKYKPAFDATVVVADYAAPADQLVLALKFGARLPLAPLMADMLAQAAAHDADLGLKLPTLLTAVPLGKLRLQERGFNQSLEIARPLSRLLNIPLQPLLVRLRDTQAQSTLPNEERRRNISRAFVVPTHAMNYVRGAHIGVIDDVITTGETLNEIAATLKRFGARRVTNIVFARTVSK